MTDMTVGHRLRFVKRRDSSENNPGELILDEEYRLEKYHLIFVLSRINHSDLQSGARTRASKFFTTAADAGRPS